jgi:hypothetical protein
MASCRPRPRWIGIALVTLVGCRGTTPVAPRPTVQFAIDAPLCSSRIPVQFSIDGFTVGSDTFRVNLSPEHTTSRVFATTVGQHALAAHVVNGYMWPDRIVTLAAGDAYTDTLPFYCS